MVAFIVLSIGLRALRRTPSVLDAEERFGVPGLAAATIASVVALMALRPEELVPAAVVTGLGLGALTVMILRDRERIAFVGRVFEGREPGVEIVWQPSDAEKGALCPVADIVFGEVVLVEKRAESTYRTTARGRGLMLLAETKGETLAPIDARHKLATRAAAACLALFVIRLVLLQTPPL